MQHSTAQYIHAHADNSHHRLQQDPRVGLLLLPILVERERVLGLVLVNLVEEKDWRKKLAGTPLSTVRRPSVFTSHQIWLGLRT